MERRGRSGGGGPPRAANSGRGHERGWLGRGGGRGQTPDSSAAVVLSEAVLLSRTVVLSEAVVLSAAVLLSAAVVSSAAVVLSAAVVSSAAVVLSIAAHLLRLPINAEDSIVSEGLGLGLEDSIVSEGTHIRQTMREWEDRG